MKRKTFIKQVGYGTGAAVLLPSVGLVHSCTYKPQIRTTLSETDIPLLDEIGETIIPSTADAPGAKATKIGEYMLLMYEDCMEEEDQQILVEGINTLNSKAASDFSESFITMSPTNKKVLLESIQEEAIAYSLEHEGEAEVPPHYFHMLKGLTLNGYFTSEIGMTQARAYLPIPGQFVDCMPYSRSDKIWAL
ncbi:MAG: gluconate 2-dehydrogenase subunit 3 family protein [Bacteroidota bacterium]